MKRILAAFLILFLSGLFHEALAQVEGSGRGADKAYDNDYETLRVGEPDVFGAINTYEFTPVFNYLSNYGLTARHDRQTLSGSATADLEGGQLSCETGTTAGSVCDVATVEYGRYESGREGRFGIRTSPVTPPTGDGVIEWGAFTDANGTYLRLTSSQLCFVYERGGTEDETCGVENFAGEAKPDDFDPTTDSAVWQFYTNWYGEGGVTLVAYYGGISKGKSLKRWVAHIFYPEQDKAFEDPNLPVRFRVDNGTATENVEVHVGGRGFDVGGRIAPEKRLSGGYRTGQTVTASGSPLTPFVCARRESTFPSGSGNENTVTAYVDGWTVKTDQDVLVWLVIDPTLSDGSWATPQQHIDAETAIEVNATATGFSASADSVTGPFLVPGGSGPNKENSGAKEELRVQFPGTDPVCLAGLVPGGTDATVSGALRVVEGW